MNFRQFIEMPIQNFNLVGNWNKPKPKPIPPQEPWTRPKKQRKSATMGWYPDDVGIVTSPVGVEKIKEKWAKCEQKFDLYLVRQKGASTGGIPTGEVQPSYLKEKFGIDIVSNFDVITMVYTNNEGAERMPANYHTLAHRFGHAIFDNQSYAYFRRELEDDMRRCLKEVYFLEPDGKNLNDLAMAIGTMKSCRNRLLARYSEFFFELSAQYITQGQCTFNPLPRMLTSHFAWGRPQGNYYRNQRDFEQWNEFLLEDHTLPAVNVNIGYALDSCLGRCYLF